MSYLGNPTKNNFVRVFRLISLAILGGAVGFSIYRNVIGLQASFGVLGIGFELLIALTLTGGCVVLAGSALLKTIVASRELRVGLALAGVLFSVGNFSLNLSAAQEDNRGRHAQAVAMNPEVLGFEQDLKENLERQKEYGLTDADKEFLRNQESQIRADLKEAQGRARADKEAREREDKEQGSLAAVPLVIFSLLPEAGIWTFLTLLLILSDMSIFNRVPGQRGASHGQPAAQSIQQTGQPGEIPVVVTPAEQNGNGIYVPDETPAGGDKWNPFQ